jgi:hypothetical protein
VQAQPIFIRPLDVGSFNPQTSALNNSINHGQSENKSPNIVEVVGALISDHYNDGTVRNEPLSDYVNDL